MDTSLQKSPAKKKAKAKVGTTSDSQQSSRNGKHHPLLRVQIGEDALGPVAPTDLSDTDWSQLGERCRESALPVILSVTGIENWHDASRFPLLTLAHSLGEACRIKIGRATYEDPLEAILSALNERASSKAKKHLIRGAIEAAALFHNDIPELAAGRINRRLAEIGDPKINHNRLCKQIRHIVGDETSNPKADDPTVAAGMFLDHERKGGGTGDGSSLRYHKSDFYRFRGNVWEPVREEWLLANVIKFLQNVDVSKVTGRFAKDVVANLAGMTMFDCWDIDMPFEVLQEEPLQVEKRHWIVFANGAIDLDEAISGHGPPKLISVDSRYFNQVALPYAFDPKATCKLWVKTLTDILPKSAKADNRRLVLQEFMGYSLLFDCRFQKFLVLLGDGGNGKTTVTETWQAMLGDVNYSSVPLDALGHDFRLWSLKGKMANFSGELPYLGKVNEGLLKRVVSGEEIDVNRKHKTPEKFRSRAKLIVNTNELPQIRDATLGTWDRLLAIPFDRRIRGTKKEDKQRTARLQDELSGIILWAIKGLKRLLTNGNFTACAKCDALTRQHRTESDSVLQFAQDCCAVNKKFATYSVPLYGVYKLWCERTTRKPVAEPEFGRRMKRAGWHKVRESVGTRKPAYINMVITPDSKHYVQQWLKSNAWPTERITVEKLDHFGGHK